MKIVRFRRLIHALLATAPVTTIGCDSTQPGTPMPEQAQCVDLSAPTRYTSLTLGTGIDGIVFATEADGSEMQRLESLGKPCASAKDQQSCNAKIAELLPTTSAEWRAPAVGCDFSSGKDRAVITSGDDIRVATLEEVLAAIAPIDSRDEAAALLLLKNVRFDCGEPNVRPESDGWTFKKTQSHLEDDDVTEYFWRVYRDGRVENVSGDSNRRSRRPVNARSFVP